MKNNDTNFMKEALKQAKIAFERNEVPIGALITFEDRIIARSYNQVELLKDATAHAEMIAITMAAGSLKSKWISECTLYVTVEPCVMCAGAIVLSRVKRLVFGALDPKGGAVRSLYNMLDDSRMNHHVLVEGGVLENSCREVIKDFFCCLRAAKS